MFAGKTSLLLQEYNKNKEKSYLFKISKHNVKKFIKSRDGQEGFAMCKKTVQDIINYIYQARIYKKKPSIFIDEIQFASVKDISTLVDLAETYEFNLILSGLDLDFKKDEWNSHTFLKKQKSFEQIRVFTSCQFCEKQAVYSQRYFNSKDLVACGKYKPVCEEHYKGAVDDSYLK
jgi:thymidine kinase